MDNVEEVLNVDFAIRRGFQAGVHILACGLFDDVFVDFKTERFHVLDDGFDEGYCVVHLENLDFLLGVTPGEDYGLLISLFLLDIFQLFHQIVF